MSQPPPDPPVLYTVAEIAERWRVSKMTVYRLVNDGTLPSMRFGRSKRVREADLIAYEDQAARG